jgi:hypothetical protein
MKFIIFLILSTTAATFATEISRCKIAFSSHYIILKNPTTQRDWEYLKKDSNCSPELTDKVFDRLASANGNILISQLFSDLSNIDFTPSSLKVTNIQEIVDNFPQIQDLKQPVKASVSSFHPYRVLAYSSDDELKQECYGCKEDNKEFKMVLTLPKSKIELSIKKINYIKVFQVTNPITEIQSPLNQALFREKLINESDYPNMTPLKSLDGIEFYTNIATLKEGDILTTSNIKPLNIISAGRMIDAKIKNKGLSLFFQVRALDAGHLGQSINVQNPKTNKTMSALVTGLNKVEINL